MNTVDCSPYLNYSDVLIKPKFSEVNSRADVILTKTLKGAQSQATLETNGIMITNMDTVGTVAMAKAVKETGALVALHKFHSLTELTNAYVSGHISSNNFVSVGMNDRDVVTVNGLYQQLKQKDMPLPPILIDVANGYTDKFIKYIAEVRKLFPTSYIAAGNVATPDVLGKYLDAGMDAVRIGIGPGGQCRTRETAGVGIPQLTAVMTCADEARKLNLHIIADGGVNEYADFSKAICAGADLICAGSLFAGANEALGTLKRIEGKYYKEVYGMSSELAMTKYYGKVDSYRPSEGRVSLALCSGSVVDTIRNIQGSMRSTCTYVGASNLQELWEKGSFIKVNDTINRKYEKHTTGI